MKELRDIFFSNIPSSCKPLNYSVTHIHTSSGRVSLCPNRSDGLLQRKLPHSWFFILGKSEGAFKAETFRIQSPLCCKNMHQKCGIPVSCSLELKYHLSDLQQKYLFQNKTHREFMIQRENSCRFGRNSQQIWGLSLHLYVLIFLPQRQSLATV